MFRRSVLFLVLIFSGIALSDTNGSFQTQSTARGVFCISPHPKTKTCACPQLYHADRQLPPAISAGVVTVNCVRGRR